MYTILHLHDSQYPVTIQVSLVGEIMESQGDDQVIGR